MPIVSILEQIHNCAPDGATHYLGGSYYHGEKRRPIGAIRVYPPNVWHPWSGGVSPLPGDMMCSVVLREDAEGIMSTLWRDQRPAQGWCWAHGGEDDGGDIVMFGYGPALPAPVIPARKAEVPDPYPPNVWHQWNGGETPPLPGDVECEIAMRCEVSGETPWCRGALPAREWGWEHVGSVSDILMFGYGRNLPDWSQEDGRVYSFVHDAYGKVIGAVGPAAEATSAVESKPPSSSQPRLDRTDPRYPRGWDLGGMVMPSDVRGIREAAVRADHDEQQAVGAQAVKPDPKDHRGLLVLAPIDHRPGRWRP